MVDCATVAVAVAVAVAACCACFFGLVLLQGFPNTDFVTREVRRVTNGPLAMIRFGSCGGMNETKPGVIAVADKTIGIYRNPGHWYGEDVPPYFTTPPIPGDKELTELVRPPPRGLP